MNTLTLNQSKQANHTHRFYLLGFVTAHYMQSSFFIETYVVIFHVKPVNHLLCFICKTINITAWWQYINIILNIRLSKRKTILASEFFCHIMILFIDSLHVVSYNRISIIFLTTCYIFIKNNATYRNDIKLASHLCLL